jgi:hypothetical protein
MVCARCEVAVARLRDVPSGVVDRRCSSAFTWRGGYALPVVLAVLVAGFGCGPREPLSVETIQLGRSLNPDNSVASHTTVFKPDDTIYVAVLTPAAGHGTIGVRWTYVGRIVSEPEREVSYRGPAATEFHIQNSGGFPPGDYDVEVFLNGESVGNRPFRVER